MKKKTEIAREYFQKSNYVKALEIAKTFRMGLTKEERGTLARGYECLVHPDFYIQLGKDPKVCVSAALELFANKFNYGEAA